MVGPVARAFTSGPLRIRVIAVAYGCRYLRRLRHLANRHGRNAESSDRIARIAADGRVTTVNVRQEALQVLPEGPALIETQNSIPEE